VEADARGGLKVKAAVPRFYSRIKGEYFHGGGVVGGWDTPSSTIHVQNGLDGWNKQITYFCT
jgi:hypothetical protein